MGSDFFEKRVNDAKKMIEDAIAKSQQSENKVHVNIDSVGAISALVFGEEGVVSVEPCYDDEVAGKFAHRLAYPDDEKLKKLFTEKTGKADISFADPEFQEFVMKEIEEQSKGAEWDGVSWDHTYSRYEGILYDSMQEAVDAIWSKDVFKKERITMKDVVTNAITNGISAEDVQKSDDAESKDVKSTGEVSKDD